MGADRFSFSIARTKKDFSEVLRIVSPRVWGWWRPLLNCGVLLIVAMVAGMFVGELMLRQDPEWSENFIKSRWLAVEFAAIVAALMAVLLPLQSNVIFRPKLLSPNGMFLTPCAIRIDSDGVSETSDSSKREYRWGGVLGFKKTKIGYYLFTDFADGIYIPFHAIPDDLDRDDLERLIERMIHAAAL